MHMCHKVAHLCRGRHRRVSLLRRTRVQIPSAISSRARFLSSASELDVKPSQTTIKINEHSPGSEENNVEIDIPEPEFDFEYLCDPGNIEEIRENIKHRKGLGDIDKVVELWKKMQEKTNETKSEGLTNEEFDLYELRKRLYKETSQIPNRTHPDVPIGDETQNRFVELIGEKRDFSFKPKSSIKLGEALRMCRMSSLGKIAGARSYYFMDGFAKLEQALVRYTVDNLLQRGFELMLVPDLVHPAIVEGCGFQIQGEKTQVYRVASRHGNAMLAGTGEIPLAGYFMNTRFSEKELPKKVCTVSRCFRAEADESIAEGQLYRVHQFTKVEMFALCAEQSEEILEELIHIQRDLFAKLGLHFRIMDMSSHELGAPAYRKYDLEAWLPAAKFLGELSSASNCTDYQSRRLNIKYFDSEGSLRHVHTFNGTACAIPRTIIALVENNQNKDETVNIPEVLQPYMGGLQKLVQSDSMPKKRWISSIVDKTEE